VLKLSKTTWIFLAAGIFVILCASLGMVYFQQDNEQSRLNEELILAQLRLKKSPAHQLDSQQEELESRLAKAGLQLKAAKNSLYQSTQSIEASDALFDLAEAHQVEVTEIDSPGTTTEELEGVTLSFLPLTVTVEGDVLNLIDFIYKWTHEYPTSVVQSAEITVPEPVEEEEETEEEKPSAVINLHIYTYEGD